MATDSAAGSGSDAASARVNRPQVQEAAMEAVGAPSQRARAEQESFAAREEQAEAHARDRGQRWGRHIGLGPASWYCVCGQWNGRRRGTCWACLAPRGTDAADALGSAAPGLESERSRATESPAPSAGEEQELAAGESSPASIASEKEEMTAGEAIAAGLICGHCWRTIPQDGVCGCTGSLQAAASATAAAQSAAQGDAELREAHGVEGPHGASQFDLIPKEFSKCQRIPQWTCPQCKRSNWRTRVVCQRCGVAHPAQAEHLSELVGEALRRQEQRLPAAAAARGSHEHAAARRVRTQASSSHEGGQTQWTSQEWRTWEKNQKRNWRRSARRAESGW